MSTRTHKIRKAFFGVWIAAAAALFVTGLTGGAASGLGEPRMTPADAGIAVQAVIARGTSGGG